jgi:hypothetical protein
MLLELTLIRHNTLISDIVEVAQSVIQCHYYVLISGLLETPQPAIISFITIVTFNHSTYPTLSCSKLPANSFA